LQAALIVAEYQRPAREMTVFKSIVVPLDGSAFAEHALPLAATIARNAGARLRLVRVLPGMADRHFWAPSPGSKLETEFQENHRAAARTYLKQIDERLKAVLDVPVEYELIPQDVSVMESIRAYVAARDVDLVVLTSHGRGAVTRFWLGSVADELVRSLAIPLLLVRPPENESANLGQEVPIHRILLALDGRSNADSILQPALAVGQAMKAEFVLMNVLSPPVAAEYTAFTSSADCNSLAPSVEIVEAAEMQKAGAQQYLAQLAERLRRQGLTAQVHLRTSEQPATAILAEAETGVDLIALETHGRSGLSRLIMGSVADKVIRGSSHPVLVCRGPEPGAESA
jgi:nucleotide-binding universal stress UspA family protein